MAIATTGTKATARKRWEVRARSERAADELAHGLGLSPIVASVLVARGVTSEEKHARPNLQWSDARPSLMLGMTGRWRASCGRGRGRPPVLVYGDYDVDGTTGTVVLRRALEVLGAKTGFHVPHRFTEGYGIRRDVLERARAEGYTLVISVDCGIRAFEPLEWARENGLDVIVTDHHLPDDDEGSPPAFAVLNPNQRGCQYPDKNLAGVGVAFKLAHALFRERGRESQVGGFLKVVAIGTVADVAQLVGENRAIVALGLADLHNASNPGLKALMEVAGVNDGREMRASDLGFRIGPRINAAGRMDAARAVVELFESKSMEDARRLAARLDARNRERQEMQAGLRSAPSRTRLRRRGRLRHRGRAGEGCKGRHRPRRLEDCREANRPASSSLWTRTARATLCAEHRRLSPARRSDRVLRPLRILRRPLARRRARHQRENVSELRRRLNEYAAGVPAGGRDEGPCLHVDMELSSDALSLELFGDLCALEPFGAGWPRPVFSTRDLRVVGEARVIKERHLKFGVAGPDGRVHDAIWWGGVEKAPATPRPGESIELAYAVESNTWNGTTRLQLEVQDIKTVNRKP